MKENWPVSYECFNKRAGTSNYFIEQDFKTEDINRHFKEFAELDVFKSYLYDTIEVVKIKAKDERVIELLDKAEREIDFLGLKPEIAEIVRKAEEKLGVKLSVPDHKKFAQAAYEELEIHKKCYGKLPEKIKTNELMFFQESEEHSTNGIYLPDEKTILLNLNYVFHSLFTGKLFDPILTLKHELGHFYHRESIGENKFEKLSFSNLLPLEELKNVFKKAIGVSKIRKQIENTYNDYAAIAPQELVAVAFENSNSINPPEFIKKLLKKAGMFELKDRCKLPKDHPVMELISKKNLKNHVS